MVKCQCRAHFFIRHFEQQAVVANLPTEKCQQIKTEDICLLHLSPEDFNSIFISHRINSVAILMIDTEYQ